MAWLQALIVACAVSAFAAGGLPAQEIHGLVFDEVTGAPLPGAEVQVTLASSAEIVGSATTDALGVFTISVPGPGIHLVTASLSAYESGEAVQVEVTEDRRAEVLLSLAPTDPTGIEVRAAEASGGTSIVYGQVLDGESDRPVADAEVTLGGGRGSALTRWDGRFFFPDVRPGTTRVQVEHLAYGTLDKVIDVVPGQAYEMIATLAEEPIPLEGIEVTVRSRPSALMHREVMFRYDRNVGGRFFGRSDFERSGNPEVGYMILQVPGANITRKLRGVNGTNGTEVPPNISFGVAGAVQFDPTADWTWLVTLRGGCVPAIFLDGQLASLPGKEQTWLMEIPTLDVEVMEVYPSPAFLPPEFNVPGAMCAIGIWTKRGG